MKKILIVVLAAIAVFFTGSNKEIPTHENMETT